MEGYEKHFIHPVYSISILIFEKCHEGAHKNKNLQSQFFIAVTVLDSHFQKSQLTLLTDGRLFENSSTSAEQKRREASSDSHTGESLGKFYGFKWNETALRLTF